MFASQTGRFEIVRILLEKWASVNIRDNKGNTALTIASSKGHTRIVELLKAHGATE
jgi:uncharacterized protein